jgi:repressor LexA
MFTPEKSQTEIFAENLTRLLQEKKMSQNALSRKIGVAPMSVNNWCRAISMPRNDKIDRMCQVLNVNRSDLLQEYAPAPNLSVPAARPVPMLGEICAGKGITAEESFRGYFFVDHSIRADYCLEVEGDSMKDANIFHGDIAFLRRNFEFMNGGIYAIVYGSEENAVLKRVYKQGDSLLLMPCNQLYDPITVPADEPYTICGELIGVYSPRNNKYTR